MVIADVSGNTEMTVRYEMVRYSVDATVFATEAEALEAYQQFLNHSILQVYRRSWDAVAEIFPQVPSGYMAQARCFNDPHWVVAR